jgi:hypothetical protein
MRKHRNYAVRVLVLWPGRGCCSLEQHVHNNAGAASLPMKVTKKTINMLACVASYEHFFEQIV